MDLRDQCIEVRCFEERSGRLSKPDPPAAYQMHIVGPRRGVQVELLYLDGHPRMHYPDTLRELYILVTILR
jgi:hypothetical protein